MKRLLPGALWLVILSSTILGAAIPAVATVTTTTARNQYVGNGATLVFPYTFRVLASSDLQVLINDVVQGSATYSVSGVGATTGGNVTFLVAPANGASIVFLRNIPITQQSDYVQNAPLPAETLERDLDKGAMIDQYILERVNRAILLPPSANLVGVQIPAPGAGNYIRWNLAGTQLEATSAVIDSGTFLQSGTGAVNRTIQSKLGDIRSVRDYGATCDGVTDDRAAFQLAIDAAQAAGRGGVFVPGGPSPCVIGTPGLSFSLPSGGGEFNVEFYGEGAGSTLQTSGTGYALINITTTGVGIIRNIVVRDLYLRPLHSGGSGIFLDQAGHNKFSNIHMNAASGGATCINFGPSNPSFNSNNEFTNIDLVTCGTAILLNGDANTFTGIRVSEGITGANALLIPVTGSRNTITGFAFDCDNGTGGFGCVEIYGSDNTLASGFVTNSYITGIYVQANRTRLDGVSIQDPDQHGLQVGNCNSGFFNITVVNAGLATPETYYSALFEAASGNHTLIATFGGTSPIQDLAENAANDGNVYIINRETQGVTLGNGNWTMVRNGQFFVGNAAAALARYFFATTTIDFASIAAQTCNEQTMTVTGAAANDRVVLGLAHGVMNTGDLSASAWVSAADTVTIRLCNPTVGALDPPSGTFSVSLFR